MNRMQKVAWLFVITISLAIISSLIAIAVLYIKVGVPKALSGFALLGIAGFATAFLVVGLACMLPFFILGPQAKVPIWWLPNIFGAAGLATFFVHSVLTLILYGRGGKNE